MPPDFQWILDGGLTTGLLAALYWAVRKWERAEEKYEAERTARNGESLAAATALHAEKILNVDAKGALALRDYRIDDLGQRIADLGRDLDRCERSRDGSRATPDSQREEL